MQTTRTAAAEPKTGLTYIRWFDDIGADDVATVGGKNASLGEMISALQHEGVRVPGGFATTADAYHRFLHETGLEKSIRDEIGAFERGDQTLSETGSRIRDAFGRADLPEPFAAAILEAYRAMSEANGDRPLDVAVRSSATAEDLPEASFAGQQETFLNVRGEEQLLASVRYCMASLFTDRAISYREHHGFDHFDIALSVGVQRMVRSDLASSGVLFTIDTETGFPDIVLINAAWGLGETVVQGAVNPDQYAVFKPFLDDDTLVPIVEKRLGSKEQKMVYSDNGQRTETVPTDEAAQNAFVLDDDEILQLARWARVIERHYGRPMDVEWAKDGKSGRLYVVQARPETVEARREQGVLKTYRLTGEGELLAKGLAVGASIATGTLRRVSSPKEADKVQDGDILVTKMTDPDWVPIMRRVAAIVTDQGGRTCHAAIVSRELGIPAIVGTGDATRLLKDGDPATVSCAEGDEGHVYAGRLDYEVEDVDVNDAPETKTQIMLNIASPSGALRWWRLPTNGVGLARMEFIIGNIIQIHPMALVHYDTLDDQEARRKIDELTRGYADRTEYFVDHLARGIAKIAAASHPDPVIVRMSDFKTNEYAELIGGRAFEPKEENPMLGWRGASRYYRDGYREGFALECQAIRRVRDEMGFTNVLTMIPFCRTPEEGDKVLNVMAENGLRRGDNGLEVYVMCEVPSNVIVADAFADRFDGFSIGSNDLTQLTLGVDRDSGGLADIFDERHEAVKRMVREVVRVAHEKGRKVGICGQAPSDYPEFARFLVEIGIDSMSLNPDSVLHTRKIVAEAEQVRDDVHRSPPREATEAA